MSLKARWPAKCLFLADLLSLAAGFYVLRTLFVRWDADNFAMWEWLRVWLGLCLLVPRNGLDIVAQRSAVRHPRNLRAWTALLISIRTPLAVLGMTAFLMVGRLGTRADWSVLIPLSFTIPISACIPDLAARVQGRFVVAGALQAARNFMIGISLAFLPAMVRSPVGLAWTTLGAELVVCLLWWHDAKHHCGLPGGRWHVLGRRGFAPMIYRSWEQSLTRWLRVLSWNIDALMMASFSPDLWRQIAPYRTLLMTAVFPLAGYLGAIAPLMSRRSNDELVRRFVAASRYATACGLCAVVLIVLAGDAVWTASLGRSRPFDQSAAAWTGSRFAPVVIILCSTSFLTALRRDRAARKVALGHLSFSACTLWLWPIIGPDGLTYAVLTIGECVTAVSSVIVVLDGKLTLGTNLVREKRSVSGAIYASCRAAAAGIRGVYAAIRQWRQPGDVY